MSEVEDHGTVLVERPEQVIRPCGPARAQPELITERRRADLVLDRSTLLTELERFEFQRGCGDE
jgi:hypothetical protein